MTNAEKNQEAISVIKKYVPNLKVTLKSKSLIHRFVDKFLSLLGNKIYQEFTWTTLGSWIARPTIAESDNVDNEWQILLHEGQHAIDSKNWGAILFGLLYLFPQIFGIFGIFYAIALIPALLLGAPLYLLWGLLLLVCCAPIPAFGRTIIEFRAYTVGLLAEYWSGTLVNEEERLSSFTETFAGNVYYYMFPFKGLLMAAFIRELNRIKSNPGLTGYLKDCKDLAVRFKQ
jgi:hypothetical protein